MPRCRIGLRLGFILLGTSVLIASSYATPQEPQPSVGTVQSTEENGNSNRKTGQPDPAGEPASQQERRENSVGLHLLKNIAEDQKALWIGPKSLRWVDADWLVPLGGAAAAMFVTDTEYSKHLSNSPSRIKYSKDLSNYGLASMVGIGGGLYLWGHITHDDHKIETGILAGEAAIDSMIPVYALKYGLGRERPLQDNYRGQFFQGGVSMPSEHAAAVWSIASVIAHEYPGPLTSLFAYGLASAVSTSRLTGKQHFPSDVLVGSAIGWFEGMYVYRKHHDPNLGGGEWETYAEAQESSERSPSSLGAPYVPLDSWIYPALDRLIALGYIDTAIAGLRPWTRRECARLLAEATDHVESGADRSQINDTYSLLQAEFREELEGTATGKFQAHVESLYTRVTEISGAPLTDGYDFGQTIINDFGRPYEQGFNSIAGISAWATSGRWFGYIRAEYQHAPSAPALPESALVAIAQETLPSVPSVPPAVPTASVNQVQLLDAYVGLNLHDFQISFGKQSRWWGPGDGGPLTLSNNIVPINMFDIQRVTPLKLPSILGWLGPIRGEFFLGQLTGQQFLLSPLGLVGQFGRSLNPQPFIHGQKLSFRPTRNFEFGFFRTTIYGGPGYPFTTTNFLRSLFSTGNTLAGAPNKPGKRTSGLDFSYRLPGLRNWLTFYGDGLVWDQFSPIAYSDRSAWHSGMYLSHFPMISKLDLRVEGVFTDLPVGGLVGHGFYYWDGTWKGGYRNNGNVIGSWIGRDGQGAQAWVNYWFTAKNRVQVNYRHQKVSQQFMPGGGTLADVGVRGDYWVRSNVSVSASVQYEQWLFPVIQPGRSTDVSTTIEISFQPQKFFGRSDAGSKESRSGNGDQP
jgi:Capsule assembly protein Wzi/PAP2 superfamily